MTAATTNGTFPADARTAAELYLGRGLAPIPLPPQSKVPDLGGWPDLRIALDDLDEYFPVEEEHNLGNLNGEPSGNLADVDLDCDEAWRAASLLLPATGWISGHLSA